MAKTNKEKVDALSFKEAFRLARKQLGKGKVFSWRGKRYTTNLKKEEKKTEAVRPRVKSAGKKKSATTKPVTAMSKGVKKAKSKMQGGKGRYVGKRPSGKKK